MSALAKHRRIASPSWIALALAAAFSALVIASLALADERPHVLVLSADDAVRKRMVQELRGVGIDAEIAAPDGRSLEEIARSRGAAAVARFEGSPPAVTMWIDPARFPSQSGADLRVEGDASDPSLLALRAVELLRGRLMPHVEGAQIEAAIDAGTIVIDAGASVDAGASAPAVVEAPPRTEMPRLERPSIEPASTAPSRSPFGLLIGAGVTASPGGVPAAAELLAGGGLRVLPPLRVDVLALVPISAGSVRAMEGSVDVRIGAALAGFAVAADRDAWFGAAGAGAGALVAAYSGAPASRGEAARGVAWMALPYARISGGRSLTPHLALRADVLAGIARPHPVVRMLGNEAASFGAPLIVAGAALEVTP